MRLRLSLQDGNRYKFEHDNPFLDEDEEDEVAPVGYRYRKWCLGNDINLVARTEHDSVQAAPNNEIQFINIKVQADGGGDCTLSLLWTETIGPS